MHTFSSQTCVIYILPQYCRLTMPTWWTSKNMSTFWHGWQTFKIDIKSALVITRRSESMTSNHVISKARVVNVVQSLPSLLALQFGISGVLNDSLHSQINLYQIIYSKIQIFIIVRAATILSQNFDTNFRSHYRLRFDRICIIRRRVIRRRVITRPDCTLIGPFPWMMIGEVPVRELYK